MSKDIPIQNLNSLDIVGERKDGGLDLVIIASGPLDGSQQTLQALEAKLKNYIGEIASEGFRGRYRRSSKATVTICIVCEHAIDRAALEVIEGLRGAAAKEGADIIVRKNMN